MFYVYLIQSQQHSNQKYIGHADNLKERLETHTGFAENPFECRKLCW